MTTPPVEGDATPPTDSSTADSSMFSDGTTTLPDGATFDYCKTLAERATRCGTTFDSVRCARDQGCADRAMRPDDAKAYLYCIATRACTARDDDCLTAAAAKYTGEPTVDAYVKACLEKRATCGGSIVPNDYCGAYHGMLLPDLLAKIRACFDQPCENVRTCYDAIIAGVGCK